MAGIELHAVIETPYYEGDPPWPWPVSRVPAYSFMRLSGASTSNEVGLFFGALSSYNGFKWDDWGVNWSSELEVCRDDLNLAGGLMLCAPGVDPIRPGCCAGIEGWAEFSKYSKDDAGSPWWGHDPDPCLEWQGDEILVWRCGAISPRPPDVAPVRLSANEYRSLLRSVQQDLLDFLVRARDWLISRGVHRGDRIVAILDAAFAISDPMSWEP
jgi:hypothetical protein